MKKFAIILLTALAVTVSLSLAVGAANSLGSGVAVIAEDVKLVKSGLLGQKLTFSDTDFKTALNVSSFDKITLTSIPSSSEGTLTLAGRRVGEGQVISRRNVASLSFIPSSKSVAECKFKFTVDNYAGGNEIECILKFTDKVNYAPKAESDTGGTVSVWTQRDISVFGKMEASDPEGDALEFIIVDYPDAGSVTLLDKSIGEFRYTPSTEYTGEDRFTYVVRDEWGNFSEPASVSVRVARRQSEVVYTDMSELPEYNAAVVMTALGVMSGTTVGDEMHFNPEGTVTRAEFVAMALKCAGIRRDTTLTETFFDDNGEIPEPLVGYVATAQRLGIVNGYFNGRELLFRPNDAITRCEAAIIISSLVEAEELEDTLVFADIDTVPVWARESVKSMYTLGVFSTKDGYINPDEAVSRADAASCLYNMMNNR